jgi:phospholipid-binding lipoprotein MlaA
VSDSSASSCRVIGAGLLLLSLLLSLALGACATPPRDAAERASFEETNDPLEPLNRQIFELNQFLDGILLKPAAQVYVAAVPGDARDALRRVIDNMKEPTIVINNALQGEFTRAKISFGRLALNTTIGVLGIIDVGKRFGLDKQTGDFGQTLFVWGLPEGPYLVLPVLGPSNPRDAIGVIVDSYGDPLDYLANAKDLDELEIGRFAADGIDQRARVLDVLEDLQKNALDFYAQLRSLSRQRRAVELRHGELPPAKGFYEDPGAGSARP